MSAKHLPSLFWPLCINYQSHRHIWTFNDDENTVKYFNSVSHTCRPTNICKAAKIAFRIIVNVMESQLIENSSSIVYSGQHQRNNKGPYFLPFVKRMHQWQLDFPNKQSIMQKAFWYHMLSWAILCRGYSTSCILWMTLNYDCYDRLFYIFRCMHACVKYN